MIKLGTSDMAKAYVGSSEVSKMYLGSDLVWGGKTYGENPVWINMPAGSLLLTGLYPTKSYKVNIKFFVLSHQAWGSICNANAGDDKQEFTIQYMNSATTTSIRRNIGTTHHMIGNVAHLTFTELEYTANYHKINGTVYTQSYTGAELSPTNQLAINGKVGWPRNNMCVVEASVYDGDNLLRHYIPSVDNNGDYCFLETVSNNFAYSSTDIPFTYQEHTIINRSNVYWQSGNIDQDGRETGYANQRTNYIVLPRKGCFLSVTSDSNYKISVRTYDDELNSLNYDPFVSGSGQLPPECRVIRLVMWDKPSASYVANDADFEIQVM